MSERTLEIEASGAVAMVSMNRPEVHNALNEAMIEELTTAFHSLAADPEVRVIVLSGRGRNFSAGADVESMRRQGQGTYETNLENARKLAAMFAVIAEAPKPTVARVHGAAIGGGLGLVSACDIAVSASDAKFAASEVRLGLIPSTIAPYVLRAIGSRQAKRYFLTGERFSAEQAMRIGLVHEVVETEGLDARIDGIVEHLLAGAPDAQRAAKDLIQAVDHRPVTPELVDDTAQRIATIRSQDEAREGLSAFLEKRPAAWVAAR